jgi:membrane-associated protease RseP (regulator of RpoE activity)
MVGLGTLGAVIRMREAIADRNKLVDVGAAGPLAGLTVAVPLLAWGLALSPLGYSDEPGVIEGNSLLYLGLKLVVHGRLLPSADGLDVQLHPMAFAAWVGLLITMINLIPVGQLDGGHVACAYLGERHEQSSRWIHRGLASVGAVVMVALATEALALGARWEDAAGYAAWAAAPWLVWAIMLLAMRAMSGGVYHPPVGQVPLTRGRRRLVSFMALVFVLIFTPVPLRQALVP